MENQSEYRQKKEDSKLISFILVYFIVNTSNLFLKSGVRVPKQYWNIITMAGTVIMMVALLSCFLTIVKKSGRTFLYIELISIVVFFASYVRKDIIESLLFKDAFWTMFVGIPLACATCAVADKKRLLDSLHVVSYILILMLSYNLISIQFTGSQYDMATGYAMVIPVTVLLHFFFKKRNKLDLVVAIFSIIEILIFASRGALLPIMLCILLNLLFYEEKSWKRLVYLLVIGVLIYIIFSHLETLLSFLNTLLKQRSLNSYSLQRLINGSFLENKARTELFDYYIDKINEKLFLGWGVTGGWIAEGSGPHNMLLEIILAFGIVIGGAFAIYVIFQFIKVLIWGQNHNEGLTIIFTLYSVVLLFVSGNWMLKPEVFIFLGLSAGCRGKVSIRIGGRSA